MEVHSFLTVFRRQFRFWTFHRWFNVLPSLVIALGLLQAHDRKKFFAVADSP